MRSSRISNEQFTANSDAMALFFKKDMDGAPKKKTKAAKETPLALLDQAANAGADAGSTKPARRVSGKGPG